MLISKIKLQSCWRAITLLLLLKARDFESAWNRLS